MEVFLCLFIFLLSFLMNIFFSAAEFSLTSVNRLRLKLRADQGEKKATDLVKLLNKGRRILSGIRFGMNGAKFGMFSAALYLFYKGGFLFRGVPGKALAAVLAAIIMLFFVTAVCDSAARVLSAQFSEQVSAIIIKPLGLYIGLLSPFFGLVDALSNRIITAFGGKAGRPAPVISDEEMKSILNFGELEVGEREIISNVFDFSDYKVKDIMIPRTDIIALPEDASFEDVVNAFKTKGYSRLPVYRENRDAIIGVLYLKDLAFTLSPDNFHMGSIMRTPYYTYENKPTLELFSYMKENRISMAIVLDEYGGTAGLITIEDFVEEILGDIPDEYHSDIEMDIQQLTEDEFIIDGSARIDDVNQVMGLAIVSADYGSIGGYIIGCIGRLPHAGDSHVEGRVKFTVMSMDKNRVDKIKACIQP